MDFKGVAIKFPIIPALIGYSTVLFLISLGDAVMSYSAPVFIEYSLNNAGEMGLLISTSSLAGLIFDFLLCRFFQKKKYGFYISLAMVIALLFPLSLLTLPPKTSVFIFAMVVWGLYYELIRFSDFHFIHSFFEKDKHIQSWSILLVFKSLAYILGPLIAGFAITRFFNLSFLSALFFISFGILVFVIFAKTHSPKNIVLKECANKRSLFSELKIWKVLFKKIWPLWTFIFAIFMVDATFWTAGAILSENLKSKDPIGGLLITLYMLPSLLVGFLAQKASRPLGKKRTAFISGLANGIILTIVGQITNVYAILGLVFLASLFGALAVPEILASFEDYVARLDGFGNDVISLERTAENLSYILGPITAGFIAQSLGFQKVFSVMGGLLVLVSIIALMATPRKIKMPQKELGQVSFQRKLESIITKSKNQ